MFNLLRRPCRCERRIWLLLCRHRFKRTLSYSRSNCRYKKIFVFQSSERCRWL